MSCSICGRLACARYMHSVEDQERFDRAAEFDGNVRAIMDALDARDSEIAVLRGALADLEARHERAMIEARLGELVDLDDAPWIETTDGDLGVSVKARNTRIAALRSELAGLDSEATK